MSLKDLDLKMCYNSDDDNILKDFYIPVLGEAERYDRVTGYYSSSSFAAAAAGFSDFIRNRGKMRLLFHFVSSEKDLKEIKNSKSEVGEVARKISEDLGNIEDELVLNHVKIMGWMISKGLLEIRVAVPQRIFHPKIGIISDGAGNRISFSGSLNETYGGWSGNIEEFKVFKEWVPLQREYFKDDEKKFSSFWWDESNRMRVYRLPKAINEEIIEYKPKTGEELKETIRSIEKSYESSTESERTPRSYQRDAIDKWEKNGFRGIWKMATGVGKTLNAIWGIKRLLSEVGHLVTVIPVPYTHLISQWREELAKEGFSSIATSERGWEAKIESKVLDVSMGITDSLIILTTYDMYYKNKFADILKESSVPILLICDEVHKAGATQRKRGMKDFYKYRLGLSATPERYYDELGTTYLKRYFKGKDKVVVKEYGLDKAIQNGYLTEYEYNPHFVGLTPEEMKEYKRLSEDIAQRTAIIKNSDKKDFDTDKRLEKLFIDRAKIVKNANNKLEKLEDLLEGIGDLDHTLIYCSPNQKGEVLRMLRNRCKYHQFTADESLEEKKDLRDKFADGELEVLVAMKCLDEGFNVPSARKAIFLSSTGNPMQYVQRRGRVLRPHPRKNYAKIYDVLVYPPDLGSNLSATGKSILKKEFERYEEFIKLSVNPLKETKFDDLKTELVYGE